jgi:hypothetical protein
MNKVVLYAIDVIYLSKGGVNAGIKSDTTTGNSEYKVGATGAASFIAELYIFKLLVAGLAIPCNRNPAAKCLPFALYVRQFIGPPASTAASIGS